MQLMLELSEAVFRVGLLESKCFMRSASLGSTAAIQIFLLFALFF